MKVYSSPSSHLTSSQLHLETPIHAFPSIHMATTHTTTTTTSHALKPSPHSDHLQRKEATTPGTKL